MTGRAKTSLIGGACLLVGAVIVTMASTRNLGSDVDVEDAQDRLASVLEMRADGGESGLADVAGVAVRGDGRVVAGDGGNSQIVEFDSSGKLVRRVGRRGGLQGEYVRLQWLGECGEKIVAHDIALSRVSVLDDSLRVANARSVPKALDSRDMVGCMSDQRALILNDSTAQVIPGVQRLPLAIVALDARRPRADTLRRFGGRTFNYIRKLGTGINVPLGARTLVSVARGKIIAADTDGDTLSVYENGKWRTITLSGLPKAHTATPIEVSHARQLLTWAPRTEQDRQFAPTLLQQTNDALLSPRIDALVAADDGNAWIALVPTADGKRVWIEYDAKGKRMRTAAFNWTFEPRIVRNSQWWGIERDSIGVESVVRYRVESARSSPER